MMDTATQSLKHTYGSAAIDVVAQKGGRNLISAISSVM